MSNRSCFLLIPVFTGIFLSASLWAAARPASAPATVIHQIDSSEINPAGALRADHVTLSIGPAKIELADGVLIPASPVEGVAREWTFLGNGSIAIDPPDDIERGQLRLFSGKERLTESFTSAVFTIGSRAVVASMGNHQAKLEQDQIDRGRKLYGAWRNGAERRLFGVPASIFESTLDGDAPGDGFFAAWIRGSSVGDFVYLVDPAASEQVTVGQFVPLEFTGGQRRRINREIHRQQRRGQLLGVRVADLGWFDNWISTSLVAGTARVPARVAFEPRHYAIDLDIEDRSMKLDGTATIDLESIDGHERAIDLDLHRDLTVSEVHGQDGSPLQFVQVGDRIVVALPKPIPAGQKTRISVRYSGNMLDREWSSYALRDTLRWYPHAGLRDRATYDVTIHWPQGLEVLAMGKRVDGKDDAARPWCRRVVDRPVVGFTFEIGKFVKQTVKAGHITVTIAYDPESEDRSKIAQSLANDPTRNRQVDFKVVGIAPKTREEIGQQFARSLTYFEGVWGRLPVDDLTVVTVPRDFSQSMPGFITLSTSMMAEYDWTDALDGVEDRRTVIAHEVAHQWWGQKLGWTSYRDQWISEAMANWCALDYSRKMLDWRNRYKIGPTSRWQIHLDAAAADGRPIDALGPVVLGQRLTSSLSQDAYSSIVYLKGAVALDTIARTIGEKRFVAAMRDLLDNDKDGVLTTKELIDRLGRGMRDTVGTLANLFIYGTGVPEYKVSYSIDKTGQGSHIKGSIDYEDPYYLRYRLARDASGRLAVVTDRVSMLDPATAASLDLITPIQIELPKRADEPQSYAQNTMVIRGKSTPIDIEVPWDAAAFDVDRDETTLGVFESTREDPKRFLLDQAKRLQSENKQKEAIATLKQAEAAPEPTKISFDLGFQVGEDLARPVVDLQRQILDARVELALTRSLLATGDLQGAQDHLRAAVHSIKRDYRPLLDDEFLVVESRVDIASGDLDRAHVRLATSLLRKKDVDDAEAYALLVETSERLHESDLGTAIDEARKRGVDVRAAEAMTKSPEARSTAK